jgi:hypothetical protein
LVSLLLKKELDSSSLFHEVCVRFQCHGEYCHAYDVHCAQQSSASAQALVEAHNTYVQQLRAANGMIDQYYRETLPQLLQVSANINLFFLMNFSRAIFSIGKNE